MNRIKKLIDMEALSLKRLKLVVLDMQRDAKAFSLFTLPQVRLDTKVLSLTCLFWREIFLHRLENKERIWLGSHYNFSPTSWRKTHSLNYSSWMSHEGRTTLTLNCIWWMIGDGRSKSRYRPAFVGAFFFSFLWGLFRISWSL